MIISSISGGKDSVAATLDLIERFGADQIICHHQALPEDRGVTVPYIQEFCRAVGVRLVIEQVVFEPVGDGVETRRAMIREIHSQADVIPFGTPGLIAGVTDLAMRRGWPPSSASRFCTSYFKRDLLDSWLRRWRDKSGEQETMVVMGERAAESPRRARKCAYSPRIETRGWAAVNWLSIHQWSRRQVFRKLRDWSIEPHPAYREQGMTTWQMYDEDMEGGPRQSCVGCIFATHSDVCHEAQVEANMPILRRIAEVEQSTGRTWWAPGRPSMVDVLSGAVAPQVDAAQMRLF